jgi:hypothetical protein
MIDVRGLRSTESLHRHSIDRHRPRAARGAYWRRPGTTVCASTGPAEIQELKPTTLEALMKKLGLEHTDTNLTRREQTLKPATASKISGSLQHSGRTARDLTSRWA